MALFAFSVFFVCLALVDVAVTDQDCSKYMAKKDFDMEQYKGKWYFYRLENVIWNGIKSGGTCQYVKFHDLRDNCMKFDRVQKINGTKDDNKGHICQNNAAEPGKLTVNITSATSQATQPLWILAFDLTEFTLAISCDPKENSLYVLVETRLPIPTEATKQKIDKALSDNNIPATNVLLVNQDDKCYEI